MTERVAGAEKASATPLYLMGAAGLAAAALVVVRDPHQGGSFGICPSLLLTGFYCPGCGSLRGTHDLLTGNLRESLGHNVLLIPGLVYIVWWWVSELAAAHGRRVPGPPRSVGVSIFVGVLFVVFAVVRNLPGSPLAP
ncbi:MAG: DUF2752 domain-containing protein [Nocardioides sp.]|uniref:DUF2752 domain-containing protein n=1 Tax=Nocardioides sp. TaxID=35761 RepID=UPI003F085F55